MKRFMKSALTIGLAASLIWTGGLFSVSSKAYAAEGSPKITNILGKETVLMEDGTLWTSFFGYDMIRLSTNFTEIAGQGNSFLGRTKDGRIMQFDGGTEPIFVPDQKDVKQIAGSSYWLKADGTVWQSTEKLKGIGPVLQIAYGESDDSGPKQRTFAMLQQNGDLLLKDHYAQGKNLKLGTIPNPGDVVLMSTIRDCVALLFRNGEVVIYQASNFDDSGRIIPVKVAENAQHIAYTEENPTQILLVTLKDGTVWRTGKYQARWKLDNQAEGLRSIAKTAPFQDSNHFYAQTNDGRWLRYDDGDSYPYEAPSVEEADISLSDLKPNVGDKLQLGIQETYSNGARIKVKPSASNVLIEKPHLLKLESNGTLSVKGVGQTNVTITTGGHSKTLKVSSSLTGNLTFAKQANGTVYLPAKTVIKALGGTSSGTGGTLEAKIGDTSISVKAGDRNAVLNGEPITLTTAPVQEKNEIYLPASLLTAATGAQVKWDGKWKSAEISFGGAAKMTVVSVETAAIVKKAMQGSLAKYIGRDYWINYFQDWDRFSKVTVTDVVPQAAGDFVVQFRNASGKKLEGYPMSSYQVQEMFTGDTYFFNYDPKKKYKWSAATWNQIKAGKVVPGMTKDQVKLSRGLPAGSSVNSAGGKIIETWVYYNFDTVAFMNGKVFMILE